MKFLKSSSSYFKEVWVTPCIVGAMYYVLVVPHHDH